MCLARHDSHIPLSLGLEVTSLDLLFKNIQPCSFIPHSLICLRVLW